VIFKRDKHSFVWTAAHVVAGLRNERKVVDPATGVTRTVVEFEDAKVVKVLVEDGRTVGRYELDAEVIKYSNADHGEDLALLRVRAKNQFAEGAKFYKADKPPQLGTKLYHVGSLLGEIGSNSLTDGIVSQRGRLINKTIYDQTNATSFPGSSGGGLYEVSTGLYVGMLVRGAGEGFSLYVPVRRMRSWARRVKVDWAMDETVKMPGSEPWKNLPIEDVK
jgi:S1-C subfamily serine protease